MRLDDIDFSKVDLEKFASLIRRKAEGLAPGERRDADIDTALACEAISPQPLHSRTLRLRSLARIPAGPGAGR